MLKVFLNGFSLIFKPKHMKLNVLQHPACETCQSRIKSVFCHLDEDNLKDLSIHKTCSIIPKGQTIFWEGNKAHGMYCINIGVVKLSILGVDGKEQIVRMVKAGDILGYRALITGEEYTSSAVAMEDTTVCHIPRENFIKLLEENSELSMGVMKLLSKELDSAEKTISSLAQKQVRERVAETLLMLKEFYGTEEDGFTIQVPVSRYDIASIVGTARETATRLLSELKHEKVIDFDAKKIKILNPKELILIANLTD